MGKYQQNKREQLKEKCLQYLGGKKCKHCGINYLPISCYDFHHVKGDKEDTLSRMIGSGKEWYLLKKELDKCVVLCANCHRLIHKENIKFI